MAAPRVQGSSHSLRRKGSIVNCPKKVLLVMGTRPEIIKMAPIYHELKKHQMQPLLLHTGQHTDMASSLYDLFDIVPDFSIDLQLPVAEQQNDLRLREKTGSCGLSSQTSQLLQKVSEVMTGIDVSAVLVHGDTSSALTAAMAAFYRQLPVAHIEAGLRSHNEYNPFPEEMNRVLIAKLAHWHFSPAPSSRQNLLDEGVADSQIHVVGNTIVEAARLGAKKLATYRCKYTRDVPDLIDRVSAQLQGKKMVLVTVHRRENQESNIGVIAQAVREMVENHPGIFVVWPVHPNPVVQNAVHNALQDLPPAVVSRLYLTEPLDYPLLLWALEHAWLILTDSGGIQEEAVALNTPVLVLRDTTERPEIIAAGAGLLVGTIKKNIISAVNKLLHEHARYDLMCNVTNPYGDGSTAKKICHILAQSHPNESRYIHAA